MSQICITAKYDTIHAAQYIVQPYPTDLVASQISPYRFFTNVSPGHKIFHQVYIYFPPGLCKGMPILVLMGIFIWKSNQF